MDFRGVPPMAMNGNLSENWKFWRQRFETYLAATEINKKEEKTQCAQLLTLIGDEDKINAVDGQGNNCGESWAAELLIENKPVTMKLDTGAMVNVIPENVLKKIKFNFRKIQKTEVKLNSYTNNELKVLGECYLNVRYKNENFDLFFVVKTDSCPILGLDSCVQLNLIQRVNDIESADSTFCLINKYEHIFKGIGCLNKPYKIELKENAKPVVHATRAVPFAIQKDLKKALDNLEQEGIIEKTIEGAEWVHPLVIVRKKKQDNLDYV
ncbi:uncharacterized protein [Leptinotarsa decemlineata]|uniref:uncharacterized protein n=1 Tax=Leptinotarsa decemlineata TaxID=7539 RepID=UPI003D3098F6